MPAFKMHKTPDGRSYWERCADRVTMWDPPLTEGTVFAGTRCFSEGEESWRCSVVEHAAKVLGWNVGREGSAVSRLGSVRGEQLANTWDNGVGGFVLPVPAMSEDELMRVHGINMEDGLEETRFGPVRFFRKTRAGKEGEEESGNVVSTVVFTFGAAYREVSMYAGGLVHLCEAVRSHLPGFRLRVYYDASVRDDVLERCGEPELASMWRHVWERLGRESFVDCIQFFSMDFLDSQNSIPGHKDLFGTLMRLMPIFEAGEECASWAGGNPRGCVYVADADFSDGLVDHIVLHTVQFMERVNRDEVQVELASVVGGGSTALRHRPWHGIPSPMVGQLINAHRLPGKWFRDYLIDASRTSAAQGAWYGQLMRDSGARVDSSFKWRKVGQQVSHFPFGVDESFLTAILIPCSLARKETWRWMFVAAPFPARPLAKSLDKAAAAESRLPGNEFTREIVQCCAMAAGDEESTRELESGDALVQRIRKWASVWPYMIGEKLGGAKDGRFVGPSFGLGDDVATSVSTGVCGALSAVVTGMATGTIPVDGSELEFYHQNLRVLSEGTARGVFRVKQVQIGQGGIQDEAAPTELATQLLDHLCGPQSCAVPDPELPFPRRAPPKPRSKRANTIFDDHGKPKRPRN